MPRELAESLDFMKNSQGLGGVSDRAEHMAGTGEDLIAKSLPFSHRLNIDKDGDVRIVHNQQLKVIAESFLDSGRECWCPSGVSNACKTRSAWQFGELAGVWESQHGFSMDSSGCSPNSSQFAFKVTVQPATRFNRTELAQGWDRHPIVTRVIFEVMCCISRLFFRCASKGQRPYGWREGWLALMRS